MEVFNFMPYTYYTRMTSGRREGKHVTLILYSSPPKAAIPSPLNPVNLLNPLNPAYTTFLHNLPT